MDSSRAAARWFRAAGSAPPRVTVAASLTCMSGTSLQPVANAERWWWLQATSAMTAAAFKVMLDNVVVHPLDYQKYLQPFAPEILRQVMQALVDAADSVLLRGLAGNLLLGSAELRQLLRRLMQQARQQGVRQELPEPGSPQAQLECLLAAGAAAVKICDAGGEASPLSQGLQQWQQDRALVAELVVCCSWCCAEVAESKVG